MARADKQPYFVQEVPLLTSRRDGMIIDQRLQVVGQLRNAGLNDLLKRVGRMRRDPRWAEARLLEDAKEKSQAYRNLKHEYGLQAKLVPTIVHSHWKASQWMTQVVDSRTALALGAELLQNIEEWLYGRAERPRMKPTRERDVVWGVSDGFGLRIKGETMVWRGPRRGPRKQLLLKLDWSHVTQSRRAHLQDCKLICLGIRRELIRGRARYFALLCYEGMPYRNREYLAQLAERPEGLVAFDLNVASVAVVSREQATLHPLSPQLLKEQKERAALERRRKRAIDRSRRASNPEVYDERGRHVKGKRARKLSKRGQRRQDRLSSVKRKERESRRQQEARIAKTVALAGSRVAFEKTDKASWMAGLKGLGKKMGLTAPGAIEAAVKRELGLFAQGVAAELPISLSLSQVCLCGHKEKKELGPGYRVHHCSQCRLGPLDRDLFSALLALLCAETGIQDFKTLSEGPFNTDEVRALAVRLCANPSRRAPRSDESPSSSVEGLAREAVTEARVDPLAEVASLAPVIRGNDAGQTPGRGPAALSQAEAESPGRRPGGEGLHGPS